MATCPTCRTRYDGGQETCPADGAALLADEAFISADRDLEPGDTAGEYKIESKLGEGSYGTVYRALHPVIGKSAAVKVLKRQYSANPEMVSRFISEARAVNQIRHRNIIDIFAFGTLPDGRHYYVMELLEGQTLEELIKERERLTPDEAMPILRQLSRALGAAHAAGILHRDIKPENVFLTFDDDGQPIPKLLDFGIAKLQADENTHKTRSGTPMGTPLYMSPEQIRAGKVDHRADIYSFGVLVHEVLTGKVPFDGNSVIDVLMKHTTASPPAMSDVCPELPAILDSSVLHMLEKDPDQRPSSITAAVDALLMAAGMPLPPPSMTTPPPRAANRSSGPRSLPPAEAARTVAEPSRTLRGSSLGGSNKPPAVVAPVKRAWWPFALVAGAIVASAVFLGMRRAPSPAAAPPTVTSEPSAPPLTAPLAATPHVSAAAAPPAPSASVDPVPPTITVTFHVTPPDAEVFLGDEKLGVASKPIEMPRGEGTHELTIRKTGYVTKPVKVPADAPSTLTADLVRVPAGPTKPGKKPGDLEF